MRDQHKSIDHVKQQELKEFLDEDLQKEELSFEMKMTKS